MNFKDKLQQPSTYRGLVNCISGASVMIAALFDPGLQVKVLAVINALTFMITGMIGVLGDDKPANKATDIAK